MNESKYAFSDGKDSIDRVMKGGEVIPDSFPNSLSLDKIGIEGDQPGKIGRQVCNGSKLASKPLRILLKCNSLYLIGNLVDAIDIICFIPS